MKNIYVVNALRTPFGSFGGTLADVPAPQLAAGLIGPLLASAGLAPEDVDEVILGQVVTGGVGQAPARQAMRMAGIPDGTPAMTINKVCGSGLKSVMLGADAIRLGEARVVLVGGMENMSLSPYVLPAARFGMRMGNSPAVDLLLHDALTDPGSGRHMGDITEAVIAEAGLSRADQDAYAIRSYERAQAAARAGRLAAEIEPVVKKGRKGETSVKEDEEPFRVDFSKIEALRPVFSKEGTITAANASTINDGAALVLLADEETVRARGLKPLARLVAYATNSLAPERFPEAPVGAIERACAKAGLTTQEIGLFEINEAFSAVALLAIGRLGLDPGRVNVNGGAVSIGHPVGASGGRIVNTLVREMQRSGERYGLATLCIGGGEAVAAVFERV